MLLPVAGVPHTKGSLPGRTFCSLSIKIETRKGETRVGNGWSHVSSEDYGFIEGFTGADGDEIDCYLGPDAESRTVYVVDQNHLGSKQFDEHKVMLAFNTIGSARKAYINGHTDGLAIFRGITAMPMETFKLWLQKGNLSQPIGD